MARCKLTRMNLRNIRKTKEYQVLLIDLVAAGVIGQSAAEGILGYTIPAGLLGSTTPADDDNNEEEPEAETPVITTDLSSSASLTSEVTTIDLTIVASVTDDGTLSYAWTKDGDAIVGATAATLTVNEAGTYQCTVTNTLGEDTATAQSTACVVTAAAAEETTGTTVTLLYFYPKTNEWKTAEYDLTEDPTGEGIVAFAQTEFSDDEINAITVVEEAEAPDYVEGESELSGKYVPLDPQPEALESGMLLVVSTQDAQH